MNIIHITHGKVNPFEESGMSRVVYYLNKYQKLTGHNSQIWSIFNNMRNHETYDRDDHVKVELFPRPFSFYRNRNSLIRRIQQRREEIDIAHFHLMWLLDKVPISRALVDQNIPYVVTSHGAYTRAMMRIKSIKKQAAKHAYELKFLNRSNGVIAQTPEEISELRDFGVTAPIHLSSIGIEEEEIPLPGHDKSKLEAKHQGKQFIFCWIGNIIPIKNLDNLIRAFAYLPDNLRKKIKVLLVGSLDRDRHYVKKLRSMIEGLGFEEQFDFKGPVYGKDKFKILQSVDAYIHVSTSETVSLSVLEAMVCSKPLILSRSSQVSYLYDKHFFIMVEPWYDHIAQGIKTLVGMPDAERAELGERAREVAKGIFAWDKVVANCIEIYKVVTDTHEPA